MDDFSDLSHLHVAVLAGGPGSEREVSLASATSVVEALTPHVGRVTLVDIRDDQFELPPGTDIGFNVIHGTFGEDGTLQRLMEARGVPYTGARADSSAIAFDKVLSKNKFLEAGVQTPTSQVFMIDQDSADELTIPCVVKPPREGSSVGVHIVNSRTELAAALADASKYSKDVLVEQFIVGRELTVGVVGDDVYPVVEIKPRSGFYDMANKYPWMNPEATEEQQAAMGSDYFCPADLPEDVAARILGEAKKAHQSVGAEVYSRVDVLLDADHEPWVLEVNTIPGMTSTSLLPKAAAAAGTDFSNLCLKIIKLSLTFS